MPTRAQPRPKPPHLRGHGASQDKADQAQRAPSPKAQVSDNVDMQDANTWTDPTNPLEPQPSFDSIDNSTSTPTASASSPPSSRRPRQRLASILPRSSSNTPTLMNPDGELRSTALKYKPKSAARKPKEEREAAEKADAERRAARQALDAKSNVNERDGYFARGRGRGGIADVGRGRDQRFNLSHGATGHLGGSTVGDTTARRGRGGYGSRGGGGGGGGGGVGGGGTGRGGGEGVERGARSGASDSTSTRLKKEPAVNGEKDRDGDIVMGSSATKSKLKRAKIKREDQAPTYVSSDEEFDAEGRELIDVERINLVTDNEGSDDDHPVSEVARGKKRQRLPAARLDLLRPVRIQRQEHVERAVGVNTDASSLTSAELRRKAKERNEAGGSLFLPEAGDEAEILHTQRVKGTKRQKDVEFVKDERKWKGVYQEQDDEESIVTIKHEPKDDGNVLLVENPLQHEGPEPMAVDEEEAIPISGAIQILPDISGAVPQQPQDLNRIARDIAEIEKANETAKVKELRQPDEDRGRADHYHDTDQPLTHEQIEAVRAELSAEMDEVLSLLAEIGSKASSRPAPSTKTEMPDDATALFHEANVLVPIIEGSNYTFQLPPLLPSLRDNAKKTAPPSPETKLKPKPTAPARDSPKPSASSDPFANPIKEEPDTKPDPDALGPVPSIPHTYISGGIYHPAGHAGRFRIHGGGKMSVNWGGMGMEVSRCGEGRVDTPQELVVTAFEAEVVKREDEGGWEERVLVGSKGWGLGMNRPGFVGVPRLGGLLS